MADWYAIYRISDGELISLGTVVADRLPAGLAKKPIPGPPSLQRWNTSTLEFEAKPLPPPDVDRVDEFIARLPRALRTQDETRVRAALVSLLGDQRYRDPSDAYEVRRR